MSTISEILKKKKHGLYYYNRVILPFNGCLLKIIIEDNMGGHISVESDDVRTTFTLILIDK